MSDVIYCLRRNDLIKIGWSGNLKARMRTLRPDALLAVEPGCLHIETGRHHQFAEHRLPNTGDGDEWFRPAPELLAHIELIARMYPTPDLADLMPNQEVSARARARGPQLLYVIPPVPTEEREALRRLDDLRRRDKATLTRDELLDGVRACEMVRKAGPGWQGRIIMALRNQGHSWSAISTMLDVPMTTLHNQVNRSRAAARLAATPEGVSA